ncbi:MAG TPA: phosphate ABC transporter substrate-binding protein PstS [Thermoplasmata archaeon]|nr:phosphate ABC transporter substrate-binding protein PstS [Thermoplasmata archaeon]
MIAEESSNAPSSNAGAAAPPRIRRRQSRWGLYLVVGIILLAAIIGGVAYEEKWVGGSKPAAAGACPTGETLQGNGAAFIGSLAATWVANFNGASGDTVNYVAGGSGTGITDLTDKSVDFAATDEPLTSAQVSAMPSPVLTLPVTAGALSIIYNVPGVPAGLKLSGPVLADIYLGTITSWNDPAIANNNSGVSLPSATITTVHRSDAAGTTFVLTDFLSQDSPTWANTVGKGTSVSFPKAPTQVGEKGNSALLTYVQTTADTIGYSDLTDVLTASTATNYAAVLNPTGNYILPNLTNTAAAIADRSAVTTFPSALGNWSQVSMVNAAGAQDYPLATFAYFFVYQAADQGFAPSLAKTQVLVDWLNWVLTAGQSDATGLSYVPLASAVVHISQAGVQTMTYGGANIPSCG